MSDSASTRWPAVRLRLSTGRWSDTAHGVYASGNSADGGLHGFDTFCGRPTIGTGNATADPAESNYIELPRGTAITCARCMRVARRLEEDYRL